MRVWTRPLVVAAMLLVVAGALPTGAAQSETSYQSPTYGYAVSWDADEWTTDEAATLVADGPEVVDQLVLRHSDGGILSVIGGQYGYGDATGCVTGTAAELADQEGVSDYGPLRDASGAELAGVAGDLAFAGFQYTYAPNDAAPLDMVNFIECRLLPESDAALVFMLTTTPDLFEQEMAAAGAVNATLQLAEAAATATPAAEAVAIDEAWFAAQVAAATAGSPVVGPLEGELVETPGEPALVALPTDAESFYLRVRFQIPEDAEPWDVGVAFRERPTGEHYRLVIDSFGNWYLSLGVEDDVQQGEVTALDTAPGGIIALELVVAGDVGAFRLNGELVGPLDLSALSGPGQLSVGTAFFADDTTAGAVTRYRDLHLWPLAINTTGVATPETEPTAEAPPETPMPNATVTTETPTTEAPTATPGQEVGTPAAVSSDQVVVRLRPVNDSGVEGLAILYAEGDRTSIAVTLLGVGTDHIGAIHAGTCDAFEPLPAYPLAAFDEVGRSTSRINVDLGELRSTPLVILLHQGVAEFGTVLACGEIPPG